MKLFSSDLAVIKSGGQTLRLSHLFLPMFAETSLKQLLSTVSVFILGRYSDNAVASVGVASQVLNMLIMFFSVVASGAMVVISQNLGAGNHRRAAHTAGLAIAIASVAGLVLGGVFSLSAPWAMRAMQLEEALLPDAISFFRMAALTAAAQGPLAAMSAICNANGRPRISMLVALFMNAVNLAGSYIVIFRPFETPFHGTFGVAVARGVGEVAALALMVVLIRRAGILATFPGFGKEARNIGKDILRIGVPSGVESVSYNLSQVVATGVVASLGAVAVATRIYVQNIIIFVFILGMALGQATALMVGRLVGAGDFERAFRLNKQALRVTLVLNSSLALIMVLLRYPLMRLFTQNEEIIALGAGILCIDFFAEVARGVNHIEQNSLHAAGDVRFTMVLCVCASWLISSFGSWLFGIALGWGLYGCWLAFVVDETVRGSAMFLRWRSRKWESKALVHTKSS
ncbi:MATE family efflux transporter [Ruminococcaceae bacterium OttesenSCG-928-D13]|nr:MATE family efflux transporter [Ruminococcaceae bacterium OttesenSCG-928-D13]